MWLDRFRPLPEPTEPAEGSPLTQPRGTRFQLEAPICFAEAELRLDGQCINVSDSGLLAKFDKAPELWAEGQLTLEAGEHYLTLHARVARLQGNDAGFAFSVETENDRATIEILLNSVSSHPVPSEEPEG